MGVIDYIKNKAKGLISKTILLGVSALALSPENAFAKIHETGVLEQYGSLNNVAKIEQKIDSDKSIKKPNINNKRTIYASPHKRISTNKDLEHILFAQNHNHSFSSSSNVFIDNDILYLDMSWYSKQLTKNNQTWKNRSLEKIDTVYVHHVGLNISWFEKLYDHFKENPNAQTLAELKLGIMKLQASHKRATDKKYYRSNVTGVPYHIALIDKIIVKLNELDDLTYGVSNHNGHSLQIVSYYNPTDDLNQTLAALTSYLKSSGINIKVPIMPHNHTVKTECPGKLAEEIDEINSLEVKYTKGTLKRPRIAMLDNNTFSATSHTLAKNYANDNNKGIKTSYASPQNLFGSATVNKTNLILDNPAYNDFEMQRVANTFSNHISDETKEMLFFIKSKIKSIFDSQGLDIAPKRFNEACAMYAVLNNGLEDLNYNLMESIVSVMGDQIVMDRVKNEKGNRVVSLVDLIKYDYNGTISGKRNYETNFSKFIELGNKYNNMFKAV